MLNRGNKYYFRVLMMFILTIWYLSRKTLFFAQMSRKNLILVSRKNPEFWTQKGVSGDSAPAEENRSLTRFTPHGVKRVIFLMEYELKQAGLSRATLEISSEFSSCFPLRTVVFYCQKIDVFLDMIMIVLTNKLGGAEPHSRFPLSFPLNEVVFI